MDVEFLKELNRETSTATFNFLIKSEMVLYLLTNLKAFLGHPDNLALDDLIVNMFV